MGQSIRGSSLILLLIGWLCLGVTMQILGVSLSFLSLAGSTDSIESSLLEGFSLISAMPVVSPMCQSFCASEPDSLAHRLSPQHLVFHPPLQMI